MPAKHRRASAQTSHGQGVLDGSGMQAANAAGLRRDRLWQDLCKAQDVTAASVPEAVPAVLAVPACAACGRVLRSIYKKVAGQPMCVVCLHGKDRAA